MQVQYLHELHFRILPIHLYIPSLLLRQKVGKDLLIHMPYFSSLYITLIVFPKQIRKFQFRSHSQL